MIIDLSIILIKGIDFNRLMPKNACNLSFNTADSVGGKIPRKIPSFCAQAISIRYLGNFEKFRDAATLRAPGSNDAIDGYVKVDFTVRDREFSRI